MKLAKIGDKTLYVDSEGAPAFEVRKSGRIEEFKQYFTGSSIDGEIQMYERTITKYNGKQPKIRIGKERRVSKMEAKILNNKASLAK